MEIMLLSICYTNIISLMMTYSLADINKMESGEDLGIKPLVLLNKECPVHVL